MKFLIKYLDFHWDNHQGGSGKSFTFTILFEVPDAIRADQMWEAIHLAVKSHSDKTRPFNQRDERYRILSVELL